MPWNRRAQGGQQPAIHPQANLTRYLRSSRQYVYDLVSRCDKSGDVQTIALLKEDREALQRRVEELEDVIKLLNHSKTIE